MEDLKAFGAFALLIFAVCTFSQLFPVVFIVLGVLMIMNSK